MGVERRIHLELQNRGHSEVSRAGGEAWSTLHVPFNVSGGPATLYSN